ncbi:hypothetical protein [Gordonia rhizosphera]|uniref:Uncharacterized protein n=1 Tax=Gordonia rhizosphera NBRC 16068 TaxID=1108045 RepID=K6WES0_9ACTN|nr:hypothetical protein [Gordonia rhizosphera]GAB92241.1 hypothetical protein GORHZ_168_00390 [Gordonia rhizosphera NBRC 16068]
MAVMRGPRQQRMLGADAVGDYLLGLPLLIAPRRCAQLLALPDAGSTFYPRVLGGVLAGTATASVIERVRKVDSSAGLGVAGAAAVNTLGGGAVAFWLTTPEAAGLPRRGRALLWGIASGVLALGAVEAWALRR